MSETPQHRRTWTTEAQKFAICADYGAGMPRHKIAAKYDRNVATITRIVKRLKSMTPTPEVAKSVEERANELVDLAFPAVEAGLRSDADPYKKAATGIAVLKGRGVFAPDSVTGIQAVFTRVPADWRAEYAIPGDSAPQLPTPSE